VKENGPHRQLVIVAHDVHYIGVLLLANVGDSVDDIARVRAVVHTVAPFRVNRRDICNGYTPLDVLIVLCDHDFDLFASDATPPDRVKHSSSCTAALRS
jgi:hypothetical protein